MKAFNAEYRRQRLARARTRRELRELELSGRRAGGPPKVIIGNVPPGIVARVFEDRRPEPR
jgi:hypothetical protein